METADHSLKIHPQSRVFFFFFFFFSLKEWLFSAPIRALPANLPPEDKDQASGGGGSVIQDGIILRFPFKSSLRFSHKPPPSSLENSASVCLASCTAILEAALAQSSKPRHTQNTKHIEFPTWPPGYSPARACLQQFLSKARLHVYLLPSIRRQDCIRKARLHVGKYELSAHPFRGGRKIFKWKILLL